jgi:hypothetical protein
MLQLFLGISLLVWNRVLLRMGLRKPVNGWRRGASLVLRGETARFVLSAFSLDVFSDESRPPGVTAEVIQNHLADRLAKFLEQEKDFHLLIRHDREQDVVVAQPSASYSLGFQPWVDGPARFIRPDSWEGAITPKIAGTSPVLEFVCRINAKHLADVWVRVNHVAADGAAVQEMLSRLEAAWGVGSATIFPSTTDFEPHTSARPSPGRHGTAEVQTFIDFSRLLDWRKKQNAKLPEPMTVGAAMLWWLARHETLSGLYFGTTVDLPPMNGTGRAVSMLVVRPVDYFGCPQGLEQYVRFFNRQLELHRQRKSDGCKTLDAAAFLPCRVEEVLLRRAMDQGTMAFGSIGLTILKDAKVFGAPLGDSGHVNGFIAVGSVGLATTDGKRVGCVMVKGPTEKISSYARVLREALENAPID